MRYTVYFIENEVNHKGYVGLTSRPVDVRFQEHVYEATTGRFGYALHDAMKEHGVENFTIVPLTWASTLEEAIELEREWIKRLDTCNTPWGYNRTAGGGWSMVGESNGLVQISDEAAYQIVCAKNLYEINADRLADELEIDRTIIFAWARGAQRSYLYQRYCCEYPNYVGWSKVDDRRLEAVRMGWLSNKTYAQIGQRLGFSGSVVSSLCDGKHRPYILERFKTLYPDAVRRSSSRSVRNGEAHHNTTLTEADVLEIRRRYVDEERTTSYTLAEEYGTTGSAMSSIISGKTWGHVPMPDGIEEAIDAGRRRAAKGSAANKSDLTEGDVLEIRRRYVEEDITQKALSEQYQISHSSLNSIVNRKTWTHI